jgi:hypothetical protein
MVCFSDLINLRLYSESLLDPAEADFGFNFGPDPDIYPTSFGDFATFVTTYYVNPDLTSRAGASSTTVDSSKRPSLQNMTDEDLAVNLDLGASMRSDVPLLTTMLPALEKQAQAALFDETLTKEFLPGMEVVWISCPQSMWPLEWSKVLIARQYEEHVKNKRHVRSIRFTEIEGANHFVSVSIGGSLLRSSYADVFTGSLGRAAEVLGYYRRHCSQCGLRILLPSV